MVIHVKRHAPVLQPVRATHCDEPEAGCWPRFDQPVQARGQAQLARNDPHRVAGIGALVAFNPGSTAPGFPTLAVPEPLSALSASVIR